jgi:hypothetical protein
MYALQIYSDFNFSAVRDLNNNNNNNSIQFFIIYVQSQQPQGQLQAQHSVDKCSYILDKKKHKVKD